MTAIAAPAPSRPQPHPHGKPAGKGRQAGKRRGRIIDIIAIITLIAGCIGLAWPWAAVQWARHTASITISSQQAAVTTMSPEERNAELETAVDYNHSLTGQPVKDPFIPGSGYAQPSNSAYMAALNINGDGIMGSVDIDMLDIHLPIAHGTDDKTLQENAGHVQSTSLPIGGAGTHSVIAAHRGLAHAEMFTRLGEMQVGDTFNITILDETHVYQVDLISVVEPDDLSRIAMEQDRDLITLMTCTPYGVNTQRLLVRGTRINPDDAPNETRTSFGTEHTARVACLILATLVMGWLTHMRRARRRRRLIGGQHIARTTHATAPQQPKV